MLVCHRCVEFLLLAIFSWTSCAYKALSDEALRQQLPRPVTFDFDINEGPILSPILIPRVSGSEGNVKVRRFFEDYWRKYLPEWTVEIHNSTSRTPVHGDQEIPFHNFIARREPPWARDGDVGYLTLVAHYDSKYKPDGFIGATDSAAPCAMIMHAVRAIDSALTKKWSDIQASGIDLGLEDDAYRGIQVLLLDGEEAFASWTATDSIYGARALAAEWEQTYYMAESAYKTKLNSIELFVLLDLLGSAEYTPIPSWMHNTHWAYQKMAEAESRLRQLGLFKSSPDQVWLPEKNKGYDARFRSYDMQDDHIPFVARGVPILHMIPSRFPSVWHTPSDDGEHLDIPTVEDWALLTTAFAAEYLELEGYFEQHTKAKRNEQSTGKTEL